MRDPNRIDPMIEKLRELWKESPDLRLGQLVCNLGSKQPQMEEFFQKDPFYVPDQQMMWAMGLRGVDEFIPTDDPAREFFGEDIHDVIDQLSLDDD